MKCVVFILFFFVNTIFSQEKLILTYINYSESEGRVALYNESTGELTDLGFNGTMLPVQFGKKVFFNSDNLIWSCTSEGEELQRIGRGFRISTSYSGKYYSYYDTDGIYVADSSHKIIKIIEVNAFTDVTPTWLLNDSALAYYDQEKDECKIFFLYNDSIATFGAMAYQPVQQPRGSLIAYNQAEAGGGYSIILRDGIDTDASVIKINTNYVNSLIPHWSDSGEYLAFITILPDSLQPENSDMYRGQLVLYNPISQQSKILTSDFGYTDQVYPQFSFSSDGRFIYYTAIAANGYGEIKKVEIATSKTFPLNIQGCEDVRLPIVYRTR